MSETIQLHGSHEKDFQPTIEDTNKLLAIISNFRSNLAMGNDVSKQFDGLLSNFLEVTNSEYGFIGERLIHSSGEPYLKTHAITNIAWNEARRKFHEENAPTGLEFFNLASLFGHVLRHGETVISNDPKTDPKRTGILL